MLVKSSGAVWRTVTPPSPNLTTALCEISGAAGEETSGYSKLLDWL